MPLATLHLVSFKPSTSLTSFASLLKKLPQDQQPITISKVVRWIIVPEIIDTTPLLHPEQPYEVLVIIPSTDHLPSSITKHINDHFHLQIGIPSRLLKNYSVSNQALLHPDTASIPSPTGALKDPIVRQSSQSLSLSPDLQTWIESFSKTRTGQSAVSMLNLLAFIPDRKADYLKYGAEFAKSIGSKRGGNAKLVGHAVYPDLKDQGEQQSDLAVPATSLSSSVPSSSTQEQQSKGTSGESKEGDETGLEVPAATSLASSSPAQTSASSSSSNSNPKQTFQESELSIPPSPSSLTSNPEPSRHNSSQETSDLQIPPSPSSLSSSSPASTSSSTSTSPKSQPQPQKWDEFALAHYPSILHFADMLASPDYQKVNQEFRVPSLYDTCILCTSEIEVEDLVDLHKGEKKKNKAERAKL